MKKTIYLCDKCGKECAPARVSVDGQTPSCSQLIEEDGSKTYCDVCVSCLGGLYVRTFVRIANRIW